MAGDLHARQARRSSLHWNFEPASELRKVNLAVCDAVRSFGPVTIVVRGAIVSTFQAREATAEALPAASSARTRNVCGPCARPVKTRGEVQGAKSPPSRRHSKVVPPSSSVNAKVAPLEETGRAGPDVIVGTGGATVSTVHVRAAEVLVSTPSVARTWNVCDPSGRPVYSTGDVHAAKVAELRLHSKVTPGWVSEKVKVALVEETEPEGTGVDRRHRRRDRGRGRAHAEGEHDAEYQSCPQPP